MKKQLEELRFFYGSELSDETIQVCKNSGCCYFSHGRKGKILILCTDVDFMDELSNKYFKSIPKRVQMWPLKTWYKNKYIKKTDIFDCTIDWSEYIDVAVQQIKDAYDTGDLEIDGDWQELLDANIKLAAMIGTFGDCTKKDFESYPKERIDKELKWMEENNFDIGIMKEIMNREQY